MSSPPSKQRDLHAAEPHTTDRGLRQEVRQFFKCSKCTGTKRALCIGINYIGQENELHGCINDAKNIAKFIMKQYGFKRENVCLLTDDSPHSRQIPTRKNMIDAMDWLVKDAKCHDSLFFHYSGHGGLTKDLDGDEIDGYDEVIFPVDHRKNGEIVDDELHKRMVKPLPRGCRLTAVFDSCHSGTALDLDYVYHSNGRLWRSHQVAAKARKYKQTPADVISFCACKDDQTSADTVMQGEAVGAMSYGLLRALKKDPHQTYAELLRNVRKELKNRFSQRSQLSSSHPVDTGLHFLM